MPARIVGTAGAKPVTTFKERKEKKKPEPKKKTTITKPTIREVSEMERLERMKILTTEERKKIPTKAERAKRAAEAKLAIEKREFEKAIEEQRKRVAKFEAKFKPTITPAVKALPPRGQAIVQAAGSKYQQRALTSIFTKAQQKGVTETKNVQISGLSKKAFAATQAFAKTTRKGAPILQEKISVVSPTTGKVLRYPIESVVRGAETAGMIPGGIEVMARRPGVIAPALVVGAREVAVGVPKAAIADPKQFVSDIATLGILFKAPAAIKVAPKVAKPLTSKAYTQSVKLMADEVAAIGYKPYKAPVKVELSKSSFNRIFNTAVESARKQAKRDLTATEKANIRSSIKRAKQSELEAITRAEKRSKARKENTLAKQISKQFEKERIAKERKVSPKPAEIPPKARAKAERATVTDITKKSRNLADKAMRLQEKYDAKIISRSVYDSQKKAIMKQAKEIDSLRKDAIEVNKQAGKKQKAQQFTQLEAAPKKVTSAFAKAKAIAKAELAPVAFVAAMARTQAMSKAYEETQVLPMPKAKPVAEVKLAVKAEPAVKKVTPKVPPTKPKVTKKPRPIITKPIKEKFPRVVIPKLRPVGKKKVVKVKRKVTKEYTNFQIVNQIGGIAQLFG